MLFSCLITFFLLRWHGGTRLEAHFYCTSDKTRVCVVCPLLSVPVSVSFFLCCPRADLELTMCSALTELSLVGVHPFNLHKSPILLMGKMRLKKVQQCAWGCPARQWRSWKTWAGHSALGCVPDPCAGRNASLMGSSASGLETIFGFTSFGLGTPGIWLLPTS